MRAETRMLPYIDEHAIRIVAPRDVVWKALEQHVAASLRRVESSLLAKLLGTQPRAGFEVAERVPADRLALVGRHRFSRYQLAFDLADAADGATLLRATTHAEFPGVRGRVYRALVIGTRAHVVATNHILRSIRRLCGRPRAEDRMRAATLYLLLCIAGTVLPYTEFVPFLREHGLDLPLFLEQLFSTRIGGFFAWDVIVSSLVLWTFVLVEGRRIGVRHLWAPIVANLAVGVSLGLPLFLYLRERRLDQAAGPGSARS